MHHVVVQVIHQQVTLVPIAWVITCVFRGYKWDAIIMLVVYQHGVIGIIDA